LRLSAFRLQFFSFFRSYPSVIRAEAALANASTGIGMLRLRMEHRMKSVVTVQNRGPGIARAQRCAARMRFYFVIASQRVRPEVAGPMTSSASLEGRRQPAVADLVIEHFQNRQTPDFGWHLGRILRGPLNAATSG
jgi:hypothetical protein